MRQHLRGIPSYAHSYVSIYLDDMLIIYLWVLAAYLGGSHRAAHVRPAVLGGRRQVGQSFHYYLMHAVHIVTID